MWPTKLLMKVLRLVSSERSAYTAVFTAERVDAIAVATV
jgi:hypothetical protein